MEHDDHYVVHQGMSLHEKIDIVGCDASAGECFAECFQVGTPARMVEVEGSDSLFDLTTQPFQGAATIFLHFQIVQEVRKSKLKRERRVKLLRSIIWN